MSTPQDPYENHDEFGYEDHLYDENEHAHSMDGEPKSVVEHTVAPKRSSALTSAAIYIIPILLVAGLAFWQFGGMNLIHPPADNPPPATDPATAATPTDNNGMTAPATDAFGQAPTDANKPLTPPDPFAQQPTQPVTLADGTIVSGSAPAASDAMSPPPPVTDINAAATPAPSADSNNFTSNNAAPPIANATSTTPAVPAPATTTTTASTTTTNTTTAPGSVPVAANHNGEMQQRVTMLEQQLNEAQQTAQQNRQTIDELNQKLANQSNAPALTITTTETSTKVTKPAKKKTAHKATAAKTSNKTTPNSGRYTLRAVGNGNAWVSDHGSDDLQQVKVGDSLAGIGKVKSITLQKGTWVIQGTKGSIR